MKSLTTYHPFEHFVFRTPLFSFDQLDKLDEILNNKAFIESLLIASPELNDEVSKLKDKTEMPEKEKDRIIGSLYRYYQRACTRPTPFGLFAGCSVGSLGDQTEILLSEKRDYKRITRLDMNYICALTQMIERNRRIRELLFYYPNNSIYHVGESIRYVEYNYLKTRRLHKITQVVNSECIQKVLDMVKTGKRFSELVEALTDDETTIEESSEFINELIDIQLLVSELEPAITHTQPLKALIEKLKGFSTEDNLDNGILSEIEAQLADIDSKPIGDSITLYSGIIKNAEKTNVVTEIKYLFQSDMFKPVLNATVSRKLIQEIQHALIFFNKITQPPQKTNLSQFKENFLKRYDDKEMPLLFVLDNELGIGYADNTSGDVSSLVDDLVIPRKNTPSGTPKSPIQSFLMQQCQHSPHKIIELNEELVKGVEARWDDLPHTISVICQIIQVHEQGSLYYIKSAGGHSAANILGRFCHLDEKILKHTLAITEKEALLNPDMIFAEIVHLPESRIGNILLRPVLRPYEIPYLAKSGVGDQFKLGLDDLNVSIQNNRLRLRSKRLNKEIIPRMSTAHNYSGQNAMPVYQFLCDMQNQNGRIGIGFSWDEEAQQMDYLPRLMYKNCILSKARWKVRGKTVEPFAGIKDENDLLQKIKKWRIESNIPDKVLLADGDNTLYVNMNHPLSIRAWLSVVKKRPAFLLEEFLFDPATAVVRGPEGVFINEFIFSFYR